MPQLASFLTAPAEPRPALLKRLYHICLIRKIAAIMYDFFLPFLVSGEVPQVYSMPIQAILITQIDTLVSHTICSSEKIARVMV